ncbi:hypothetical protein [Parageobacillus thermoglucosidasius]|jgi:hypothetical protein|uniref:Uncharacterized protein n=3 Tax=Anoxybacillaceae TaxID=3120669 RepID=A0AAN1D6R7_PARTM|nr:hypothetical protein [Parageobacillus thermoglucosidasius]KYD14589.1 hypothetical protein B4168_1798 [Anoxybacillus flavithermus]REK53184.1 MAG: hypothetical protein C6P36_17605 [Geobacillus sp.]AEH48413.1 hypothetical protein Geoth_2516 [Parageobacillus thermoglucosidasius C56-YS93]ALF10337.1 hypothetical protein AOT13_10080 [Parageobacillus thermoglucosidasius]ANZ30418.1 hypothetical protein BCV53_10090 [Parageobacillus thermoglucosidasius]
MSYQEFLAEKEKIDYLIQQGYFIKNVRENLSGAFVEFELKRSDSSGKKDSTQVLHIQNADARKYFSSLLIRQMKQVL